MTANGTFEDFIGIWDNSVDENICKEFVKYYDWTVKNSYNISSEFPDKDPFEKREDEEIFIGSASMQYPPLLCKEYWGAIELCVNEYIKNYSISFGAHLSHAVHHLIPEVIVLCLSCLKELLVQRLRWITFQP